MEKSNFYQGNIERQKKEIEWQNADWKEQIIGECIKRFKPKSFYRWSDKNIVTPILSLNYFSNDGNTIDSFTLDLKESYGENTFDEQDVVEFITKYQEFNPFKTRRKMKKKKVNPVRKAVAAQTVMVAIMKRSKPLINRVSSLEIKTADDYSTAALLISNLKVMSKQAEQDKASIINPMKEALKKVDEHFQPFIEQVAQIEADTKAKMVAFIELNEHKAEKLMADFDAGKIKKLETVVNKQAELKDLDNSNASIRKVKEVEIINLKKVPMKYLVPDLATIKKDLVAGKTVPGCKLKLKTSIAI